ncbi:GDP-mannose 4,6-dehydratase [Sphingomonas sabuli]|uniref:GDP-mannose 4,6-dehydratase n=1 Tax=Sphingomonas sabuli TaxID=2764186 RepID=A0A7G9KZL2_9SPHN|nr:NAD-dependent epimerase/dehydratase family protein [Sphingomonas sabuli]QNM81811.1 GDP-mannose 4,6-dehydratase [Sphingomonas sabuli]
MTRVLITGTAGFIGFHLASLLLDEGLTVHGYDGMTDYYDVRLKQRRHQMLLQKPGFTATEAMLEDHDRLRSVIAEFQPDVIVHLAAQAGVRYSMEAPRAYIDSNIVGTLNVLEIARELGIQHLLMASTSSVYGANTDMPFSETEKADTQLSIYAATKKATESMAHSYAHLFGIPITMFRFFTVYGPWGRPDLALFKFVDAILDDRPIDVYNHGEMQRDFTYVADLVRAIRLLIDAVPPAAEGRGEVAASDSLSPVAPFRIVNIGNSEPVKLLDFIVEIEKCLGKESVRNYMGMQPGDVPATWADASLLQDLTGYRPQTGIGDGVAAFVDWFRDYYRK